MDKKKDEETTVDDVIGTLKDMMANFATMASQLHEISSRVEKEVSEKTDPLEIVDHYLMSFTFLDSLVRCLRADIYLALNLYPQEVRDSAIDHLMNTDECFVALEQSIQESTAFMKDVST